MSYRYTESRFASVPERIGQGGKHIITITADSARYVIPLMSAAVSWPEYVKNMSDECEFEIPKKMAAWSKRVRIMVGRTLGRIMAHEVRHQYVMGEDPHAADALWTDAFQLCGNRKHERFFKTDQEDIIKAIMELESAQGIATMIETFPEGKRNFDFPF